MSFFIKHPIITYLIVNEICATIKTLASKSYSFSSIADDVCDEIQRGKDVAKETKSNESKAKIGFKIA